MKENFQVMQITAVFTSAVFLFLAVTGCTQHERMGISPIPQSRPAAWEIQPYGPIRN